MIEEVSSCKSNEEVEAAVSKATATIETEFSTVSSKVKGSDKLASTIEWAKGLVIQGSTQVKAIGIQIVASGESSKDALKGNMISLVEATEKQIETALEQCDTSVVIEVDHTSKTEYKKKCEKHGKSKVR